MKKGRKSLLALAACAALAVLLIAGANLGYRSSERGTISRDFTDFCIAECQRLSAEGMDMSNGPCIIDDTTVIGEEYSDWVCDTAHVPRTPADNENQCPSYGVSASHFVELDTECNFIRSR